MKILETQETKMPTKNKKMIAFYQKHKKCLLIGALVIIVIVLACILTSVINNAILTNRVQSYLDGKMFIKRNGIWTTAYAFDKNTMGKEYWCSSDQNSSGDINERFRYKVKGKLGRGEVQLWYKDDGNWWYGPDAVLCEDGAVEFHDGEWSLATIDDINTIRNETLCKHEYGQTVTIKKATCSNDGETSRTCTKCNYTVTEIVKKLDHDFDQSVTIKEATCTNNGETSHTCRVCGYKETQKTEKLEHKYKDKICTECGAKKPVQKAYDVESNTWYVYDNILYFQNCKLINAVSVKGGQAMMVTYKPVCQHCQVIDDWTSMAGPEVDYEVKKIHYCDECGKQTLVWFKIG